MSRPSVRTKPYIWKEPDRTRIPGIALTVPGGRIVAHLTPAEAITLANQLVDHAEGQENTQ